MANRSNKGRSSGAPETPEIGIKDDKRTRHTGKGKVADIGDLYHVGLKPGAIHSCTIGGVMFCVRQRAYSAADDSVGNQVYGSVIQLNESRKKALLAAIDKRWIQWEGSIDKEDQTLLPNQPSTIIGVGEDQSHTRCKVIVEGTSGFHPNENMQPIEDYLYLYPIVAKDQQLSGLKPTMTEMKSGASQSQLQAEADALAQAHEKKLEELRRLTKEAQKLTERKAS